MQNLPSSDCCEGFAENQSMEEVEQVTTEQFLELLTCREPLVRCDHPIKGRRGLLNMESGEIYVIQKTSLDAGIRSPLPDHRR